MLLYLKSHPSAAEELRGVLGVEAPRAEPEREPLWLSVRETAERLGLSVSWVQQKVGLLPEEAMVMKARGRRGMRYLDWSVVGEQLTAYKLGL